ncbi:beta-lactamase family protein [Candidatus Poribacteria bacterium]|jgi:CubicO group peptidase (beta-lactamase class C family)|nr:beta-lactamase family protein [Candidatus Poribacteria bacterium]MBT5536998.1 beta-lactamase family protein [Candidatus Poribacteria bacterium]MBT5713586.1 beta-lactamase family protein [Candidatus Poribacteria bacterium]MBT7101668.1 beta-lactamase family protein [Candidatus Poribacteria bacterium]MBT7809207.1 beta-lactamase family protein [Candidatus Poribacteria bacterium]
MAPNAQTRWDDLRDYAERLFLSKDAVGGAIGVVADGETSSAGFGVTNAEHPLDVTTDTLFQIGSITKTITATVMMRLVEQGKLDLDATVRTYLPEFRVRDEEASQRATLRSLLTHTAGWTGDFFADTGQGEDASRRYVEQMADLEQLAPLGEVYSYNNAGFYLAGRIVEVVTGNAFETVARELVLEPIGMERAYMAPLDVMTHRFASGHTAGDDGPKVARRWDLPRAAWPAGGVACSIDDLLQYGRFALGDGTTEDGERILTPRSMALTRTPQIAVRERASCGIAWHIRKVEGVTLVEHSGGTNGQYAFLSVAPQRGFVLASQVNSPAAIGKVHDFALETFLGISSPKPQAIEPTPDELAAFVGTYRREPATMELGMVGARLVAVVTSHWGFPDKDKPPTEPYQPFSVTPCGPATLLITDGSAKGRTMDVIRSGDGSIRWIRHGGRLYRKDG